MRQLIILSLVAVLAFGCSQKKVVEATYENGNPRVVKYYHKNNGQQVLDHEIIYYENRVKKMEGEYKNALRDGLWKAWYENGTLWSEGLYKSGKRNGPGVAYHPNGKKYIEGIYRDDMRVGRWTFYDTTGKVVEEVDFDQVKAAADSLK